jgi:hypothetical protein
MTSRALSAVLVASLIAGCASAGAPPAPVSIAVDTSPEAAAARYREALRRVCHTGVTPEIRQRCDEAVRTAQNAQYGAGRQANFWGPRHPEAAYLDCFQSPSFL